MVKLLSKFNLGDCTLKNIEELAILEAVLEATDHGTLVVDTSLRLVFSNEKFRVMWGYTAEVLEAADEETRINHVRGQLIDPDTFTSNLLDLLQNPTEGATETLRLRDGRVFVRRYYSITFQDDIIGHIFTFQDITEYLNLKEAAAAAKQLEADLALRAKLTKREYEILKLVSYGNTSKEIAKHLNISIKTVNMHRANLLDKLDCTNTACLISRLHTADL